MAVNKKSFLLYCDQIGMFEKLPDDVAGRLIKHIFRYTNDLHPETDELLVDALFEPIKNQLKRDLKVYESICERNHKNGLKGGRPKNPINPVGCLGNPKEPKKADTDNDTDKEKDIKEVILTPAKAEEKEYYLTSGKKKLTGKRLESFKIFWEKFNYKTGKAEAAQAWLDIPELTSKTCSTIYEAAELESKNRPTLLDKGSTPKMAQGWINSRRWEDEKNTIVKRNLNPII
jgi:hypothetical protein